MSLTQWLTILGLVFGGCCANVSALESLVKGKPNMGSILTFCQFGFIAVEGYIQHFSISHPKRLFIKPTHIPVYRWMCSVVLFFFVSILNNSVWQYDISVPFHIIFRSSATGITMIIGYMFGKRYTKKQILSTVMLTVGCIVVTLSNANTADPTGETVDKGDFYLGIIILALACVLMSLLGLHNEYLFRTYGNHWREGFFYSHFLSVPLALFILPTLHKEWKVIWDLSVEDIAVGNYFKLPFLDTKLNKNFGWLTFNCVTQYFCVRGVNMLAGSTTALTLNIVLMIRKFVSLLLSMYFFGNRLTFDGYVGSIMVLVGATMYSYASMKK
ncbi:hypothetical protein BABINDRAFT_41548 [Babjeviella inositovora NRRL Y-12698]|uniref:Sugar phosphate transporter domain-containing protein n=1 Tax=Babjeviella inositovora NRRL Y-12698 TaxID=984486 RepID=A0A1E3QJB6_9ASCO|nr:uncharacterized protein BABINDRAFT_41548 [Babjeviella inositovora NRRL Y-12698]ODQ77544.1 hypothetical protein BABINDRAFT_41548 [Babjeviella inositovora NRRL Y-12698]